MKRSPKAQAKRGATRDLFGELTEGTKLSPNRGTASERSELTPASMLSRRRTESN
jgi:hypothetical protein